MHTREGESAMQPLIQVEGDAVTYAQMRKHLTAMLRVTGMSKQATMQYGGHSFRVGGAQGLALSQHSLPYIMCYGRWRSIDSVMTYVSTPLHMRENDARAMLLGVAEGTAARSDTAMLRDEGTARAAVNRSAPARWGK